MVSRIIAASLFLAALLLVLAGCGEKTVTASGSTKLAQSEACFNNNCHQNAISPGTGKNIAEEWKLSVHNTSNAAGCADCHEPEAGHPNSCSRCHGGTPSGTPGSAFHVSRNPDTDDKCAKCHAKSNGVFNTTTYDGVSQDTKFNHFSSGRHAVYVATNYKHYCRKCHNPHDTTTAKPALQQWARSAMGGIALPSSSRDFKTFGSSLAANANYGNYCVRCHTSTGFINFVSSGFTNVHALPDLDGVRNDYPVNARSTYQDTTREPTAACDTCHSDGRSNDGSAYSGKLRSVPAASIWYMYSSHPAGAPLIRAALNIKYDSLGNSNVCMPCHAGREVGEMIKTADKLGLFDYNGSNPGGISPHDFASGANLQGRSGFQFFADSMYAVNPTHKNIGAALNMAAKGACIVCHMTNDRPHYVLAASWGNTGTVSDSIKDMPSEQQVCSKCHYAGSTVADPRPRTAAFMNAERDSYRAAVLVLNALLKSYGVNGSGVSPNNNWKKFGNYTVAASGTGKIRAAAYTMGAYFNYSLFFNDPAGYTHNPIYSKQLIYDSIDWLVNNNQNFTAGANPGTVFTAVNSATMPTLPLTGSGLTYSGPYTTDQALNFICKNYVSGSGMCYRW